MYIDDIFEDDLNNDPGKYNFLIYIDGKAVTKHDSIIDAKKQVIEMQYHLPNSEIIIKKIECKEVPVIMQEDIRKYPEHLTNAVQNLALVVEKNPEGAKILLVNKGYERNYLDLAKPEELLDMLVKEYVNPGFVFESLRNWFQDEWVRFGPDGKIRGTCARGSESEGKPKCLPRSKAHSLGKKGRAKAAARKRREDPNAERSGKAINVKTKESIEKKNFIEAKNPEQFVQDIKKLANNTAFGIHVYKKRNKDTLGGPYYTYLKSFPDTISAQKYLEEISIEKPIRYPGQEQYVLRATHPKQELQENKIPSDVIQSLQNYLNKEFNANLDVDGILGPLTIKSIRKFLPDSRKKSAPHIDKTTAVQGMKTKDLNIIKKQNVTEGLSIDVPNEEWLQSKINYAKNRGRDKFGAPYFGSTTAYVKGTPPRINLETLIRLPGMRAEQKNVRQKDLESLMNYMEKNGKLPPGRSDSDSEYLPFIMVAYNGEAWVNEGNHRIMAAYKLGWKDLPVELKYFDGGERIKDGPLYPNKIGLGEQGVAETKMDELDMDLEDPKISDRQFEKIYGMTRKEAREEFSKTNIWDFPQIRDPNKPLHEQAVEESLNESIIFLNPNTVIVGQEHGRPLNLSPETSKRVQSIAKKYGAWYEGNGMDRKFTKGIIDAYRGSWDDDLLSPSIKGYPYPFLYVLFSNIKANDTVKGKIGNDPKVTIFDRILNTQPSTNYFPDRTFSSEDLTKFLKSVSQGQYDFVKMSQAPATEKNVQRFFQLGEKLMWPENWEEYPNKAGQLAKQVNDLRDKFLASRKSGVYVVGSSHLLAVRNFVDKQGVAEATGDTKFDAIIANIIKGAAARKDVDTLRAQPIKSSPEAALAKFGMELITQLEKLCSARCGPNRTMQDKSDIQPVLAQWNQQADGGARVAQMLSDTLHISPDNIKEFAQAFNEYGNWPWQEFATAWTQGEWADYKQQWIDYVGSLGKDLSENKDIVNFEDSVEYRGIIMTMYEGDDGFKLEAADPEGHLLGFVEFWYDTDGTLRPEQLEVDKRYRGQGIAKTMYDFVKGQGFKIARSAEQTDAGRAFWNKNRPGQRIWEQEDASEQDRSIAEANMQNNPNINFSTAKQIAQEIHETVLDLGDTLTANAKHPRVTLLKNRIITLSNELNKLGFDYEPHAENYFVPITLDMKDIREGRCPHCKGHILEESQLQEKKDACYYKVKSRYKVWPSAYASGALVKCRKSRGKWGSKSESVAENSAKNISNQALEKGSVINLTPNYQNYHNVEGKILDISAKGKYRIEIITAIPKHTASISVKVGDVINIAGNYLKQAAKSSVKENKIYFAIPKSLINDNELRTVFKLRHDSKGWYLRESQDNFKKAYNDALKAFSIIK